MGAVYRIKKGCGCKFCKPHKGGWSPKHKKKWRVLRKETQQIKKDLML